jgi:hypothetical protein
MKNINDRWSALSMKDRAALIDIYIKSGITDLGEMRKSYNGIPYRDLNTSEYDYFNAAPEMAPTKEGQHWDSRNPYTGRLLKREDHPTFDLTVEGEKQAGYKIIRGYDGNLYSIPNQPDNYIEKPNILEGNEKEQTLSGEPWHKRLGKAIIEGSKSARDAKIGALGAQQVRDLYSEGKNEEAQKLAEQYAKANTTGISLAAGPVSPSLLGDLAITGATTLADTLIEGDTKNLGKNLVVNSIGDVVGGTFQYVPKLYKWTKNKANDVLNINTFDDAVNSAVEFYKRNFNPDIKASDFGIIEVDNLPKNVNGEYTHGSRWIRIGENKKHVRQRGTIGHEIRHHEDADLNAPDELGSFIIGDDAVYGVDYGRQKLTEEEKQILKKAYGETKIVGEHPAINVDYKEFLEEMYIKENGKIPSAEELNTYIESLPYQLLSLARGVSSYATPWSALKTALFPNNVKKALTSVKKYGGKLNKFETGGPTENTKIDTNWKSDYKDLPQGYKQAVLKIVTDLNLNSEDAESLYNSGKLKAVIEAKYQNTPSGRVRQNDSPTSTESSNLEKKMNKMLYNSTDRVLPNMKYAIPYIKELEVKVPGVGRTTTNALDSLAKYAVQAQIPLSEALGLSAQETAFGALPQYNYVEIVGTEEEKQKARDFNRALGNSSYFRNYGIIPAENFVRDFRYNIVEDPIDRDVPPLLHAFNYWKKGNYNRGDSDHTKDVKAKGEAVMKTKVIQDWINNSKFAQKALNLSK